MPESAQAITGTNPNGIIVENLAGLITSSVHHDHIGAAVASRYLAQQGRLTFTKYNLAVSTSNLANLTPRHDLYENDGLAEVFNQDESMPIGDMVLGHIALSVGNKLGKNLLPGAIKRAGAHALLSLAVYKIEEGYTKSEKEAESDFIQALDSTSKWYGYVLKGDWLTSHYRSWLRKPEPTTAEIMGIEAARKIMKPRNPARIIDHLLEGRKLNKKKQYLAKLASDFESFTSEQA